MKAGLYNKQCTILRKTVVIGEYRDKEAWVPVRETRCNFAWIAGNREIDNTEMFYSQTARITLRSYVDIEDEDHIIVDAVEYRVISINREIDTTHNAITVNVEKINK